MTDKRDYVPLICDTCDEPITEKDYITRHGDEGMFVKHKNCNMKHDTDRLEKTIAKTMLESIRKSLERKGYRHIEPDDNEIEINAKAIAEAVRREHCVTEHSYRNCQDYGCCQPHHDKCLHCGQPKADEEVK